MIRLSREIRFALAPKSEIESHKPTNSWAGWPATNLVVPQLVIRCEIEGLVDPGTGYLCNIKVIDDLLRLIVTKRLIPTYDGTQSAEAILRLVYREFCAQWNHPSRVVALTLALSPFLSYSIVPKEAMNQTAIELTEQFEFSAAHRLHCHDLSDDENVKLFGKCNNPEGHGHNYVIEVTVSREVDSDRGQVISIHEFESTVKQTVIDRLDHKHLNRDIEYFETINPTVENIAIAIFNWLNGKFGAAKLEKVKVYETPKTWAEFSG